MVQGFSRGMGYEAVDAFRASCVRERAEGAGGGGRGAGGTELARWSKAVHWLRRSRFLNLNPKP